MTPIAAAAKASGERRDRARQIGEKPHNGHEHAEREKNEADVIERMADQRNVVDELRFGGREERRREQAGKGDENKTLADAPEGAQARAGDLIGRVGYDEGDDVDQPDRQREHDVDDQALVEEVDHPGQHALDAGNAGKRQQEREHAGDGERADRKPRPPAEFGAKRAH